MSAYYQLELPNISTVGWSGFSLQAAQEAFDAPGRLSTSWEAWNATEYKHFERDLPNVCVPVWFWSTVEGLQIGHVLIHVPGSGLLGPPPNGSGQVYYSSIEEVEGRSHGATRYVGWSEDILGKQIVTPAFEVRF